MGRDTPDDSDPEVNRMDTGYLIRLDVPRPASEPSPGFGRQRFEFPRRNPRMAGDTTFALSGFRNLAWKRSRPEERLALVQKII